MNQLNQSPPHNEATIGYLQAFAEQNYYGSLFLKFQGGEVVCLRKEETIKPNELPGIAQKRHNDNQHSRP